MCYYKRVPNYCDNVRPISALWRNTMTSKHDKNTYALLSDDELALVAADDKNALLALVLRHKGFVEAKAGSMCKPPEVEADDLFQEGVIGLLDAVKAFRTDRGAGFATFSNVCVRNRMLKILEKRGRTVSVEDVESLPQSKITCESPEDILVRKEQEGLIFEKISDRLSDAEWNVLQLYLRGFSYSRIASELQTSVKATDNAMQRVRRKLKLILRTR